MHAPVKGQVDPGSNDQSKDILASSDQQVGFLRIVQVVGFAETVNSAGAISTGILESVDMSKTESTKSEEFVQEKETVNAGDNMDSRDHGEQHED